MYLDDVILIGRTFPEHLLNLRFREACLKLNAEKCQLFQKEIRYIWHTVSPEGIATDPE
jgi:hypothetical protein